MGNSYTKWKEMQEDIQLDASKFNNFTQEELELIERGLNAIHPRLVTKQQIEVCDSLIENLENRNNND